MNLILFLTFLYIANCFTIIIVYRQIELSFSCCDTEIVSVCGTKKEILVLLLRVALGFSKLFFTVNYKKLTTRPEAAQGQCVSSC